MGGRRKDGRGGVGRTLTAQQEAVAVDVAGGMRMAEAMMKHGYSETYARNRSVVLLDNVCFQRRLTALRERAAAPVVAQLTGKILSEHERKVILSEIAAASLSDYVLAGPDGDEVSITKDSPNPHALAEVQTRTDYDQDGSKPRVVQRVKLRDPVSAIKELNLMEKVYETGTKVNVDNRQVTVTAGELTDDEIAAILVQRRKPKLGRARPGASESA